MSYSQSDEESIIIPYMTKLYERHGQGNLLSIGENDGISLSNTLALIEMGFNGLLVEPSPIAFDKLNKLHSHRENVICFNCAIGNESGLYDFYDSDSHLGNGDTSLLSTLIPSEMERWKGTQSFEKIQVEVLTFNDFMLKQDKLRVIDFIAIDAEGLDYDILKQIDLIQTKTSMCIVEYNGKEFDKYDSFFKSQSFKFYHKNQENLIYISERPRYNYE